MSSRDWSQVGSVMVRAIGGKITHHPDLTDAVRSVGLDFVLRLHQGRLGTSWEPYPYRFGNPALAHRQGGDSHLLYDELGLIVPPWKVKEHALSLPAEVWKYRWKNKWRPYARHWKFRDGPVPYTRRRGCWGNSLRWIRTKQELTENGFLEYDDDAIEYGVEARGDRRNLQTVWDDPQRHREKNWKRQRRTRWKEKRAA